MRLSNDHACRFSRLVFAALMTWVWSGGARPAHAEPDTRRTPEERRAAVESLTRNLAAIETADKLESHETYEIQAVTHRMGRDPAAIFQWVRDKTIWVPYHGTLRGEIGVLMDRMGNSLDRALLLAALLKDAGHTVRLARANLTTEQTKAILPKLRISPISVAATQPIAAAQPSIEYARLTEKMAERLAAQIDEVGKLLAPADKNAIDADHAAINAAAESALRDHWWVQRQEGATWTDLDPLLPDAAPGVAIAPATETIDPNALPIELSHRMEIRVVTERWEAGATRESVVLRHTLRPSQLIGQPVTLAHVALAWPSDFKMITDADPIHRMKETALGQREWIPVLNIGRQQIMQSSITDTGDPNANPAVGTMAKQGKSALNNADIASDALNMRDSDAPPAVLKSHLTAEWIEYEILTPGQPSKIIRRQMFDLIGPAARAAGNTAQPPAITDAAKLDRALALLTETEILALPCQVSSPFVSHLLAQGMLKNRDGMKALLGGDGQDLAAIQTIVETFQPILSDLYNVSLVRSHLSPVRADVFEDQITLLTQHQFFRRGANGLPRALKAFDIVANSIAVQRWAKDSPARLRLAQGVVDTNAEALLTSSPLLGANAADGLWTADQRGEDWLTLTDAADARVTTLDLPIDARARIRADLSAGFHVLCPPRAKSSGDVATDHVSWWRVNPTTGETLGMGANSWGTSMAEYAMLHAMHMLLFTSACIIGARVGNGAPIPKSDRGMVAFACLGLAAAVTTALAVDMILAEEAAAEAAEAAQAAETAAARRAAQAAYQKMAQDFLSRL